MSWMSQHATEHKKALLEYDPIDDKGSALLQSKETVSTLGEKEDKQNREQ